MTNFFRTLLASSLLASTLLAAPYTVDQGHSSVGFKVKHLMISNVTGKFSSFEGGFDFDEKTKTFKAFEGSTDVDSIDTGIEKRDDHLRSEDFFHMEQHPKITFKLSKYESKGDSGVMEGDLNIRGVTQKVRLDTSINGILPKDRNGKMRVGFTLSGKIKRQDFGLTWNNIVEGVSAVGDEVTMTLELQGVAK